MHQKTLFLTLFFAFMPVVLLAEPPQSPVKAMKYMVKSGDCLWTISRDVLQDPLKWPLLYQANEGKIGNPNLIYPGQKFAIPPPSAMTKANLRKATRLAYAKPAPIATDRAAPSAARSPPVKEEASAMGKAGEKAVSPPAASEEKPAAPAASAPASGSTGLIVLVVLLVLVGGFFLWKKMGSGPAPAQEPRPLSSYSEVRNVIPMPSAPPKEVQPTEPPMRSGTITSISMPSAPVAAPVEPKLPEPTTPTEQVPPPQGAQTPAPPAAPPAAQENKPEDSTHHVA